MVHKGQKHLFSTYSGTVVYWYKSKQGKIIIGVIYHKSGCKLGIQKGDVEIWWWDTVSRVFLIIDQEEEKKNTYILGKDGPTKQKYISEFKKKVSQRKFL